MAQPFPIQPGANTRIHAVLAILRATHQRGVPSASPCAEHAPRRPNGAGSVTHPKVPRDFGVGDVAAGRGLGGRKDIPALAGGVTRTGTCEWRRDGSVAGAVAVGPGTPVPVRPTSAGVVSPRACPGRSAGLSRGRSAGWSGGDQRAFPGRSAGLSRGRSAGWSPGRSAGLSPGEISGLFRGDQRACPRGRTGGRGPGGDGYALRRESGRPEALTRVVASPRAGPFLPWVTSGAAGNGRARHP